MKTVKARAFTGGTIELPVSKISHFRPSVYGIIVQNGKILLMNNRNSPLLSFPGGGIDLGETNEEALHREIAEETGITATINHLISFDQDFFYYEPKDILVHTFIFFYDCTPLTLEPHSDSDVADEESEKPRWFDLTDLKPDQFVSHGSHLLNYITTGNWQ